MYIQVYETNGEKKQDKTFAASLSALPRPAGARWSCQLLGAQLATKNLGWGQHPPGAATTVETGRPSMCKPCHASGNP